MCWLTRGGGSWLPGAVVGPAWPALASPTRWCCTAHCCPRGWKPPTGLSANPPCLQREPDWRRPAIPRRSDDSFHKQAQHSLTSGEHLGKPASGQKSFFFGFRLLFIHSLTSVSADKRVILSTRIDYFVGKSLSSLKYTTRLKIHQMAHIYTYCFQTKSFYRIQNGGKKSKGTNCAPTHCPQQQISSISFGFQSLALILGSCESISHDTFPLQKLQPSCMWLRWTPVDLFWINFNHSAWGHG